MTRFRQIDARAQSSAVDTFGRASTLECGTPALHQFAGLNMSSAETQRCPAAADVDRRKSAPLAAKNAKPDAGALRVTSGVLGRAVMRSMDSVQAGAGAESLHFENPEHAPVFFLDGAPHRHKRMTLAKFLRPRLSRRVIARSWSARQTTCWRRSEQKVKRGSKTSASNSPSRWYRTFSV